MELSKRLLTIASFVEEGMTVADIGTDHGYIPIYLAKHHISPKVLAMDVNMAPLKKAASNAKAFKQENVIETRLSKGLENLLPAEVDCVIIAGMGGKLIESILEDGRDKVLSYKKWILSPHKDIEALRKQLERLNLTIIDEELVYEEGHYYNIIIASNSWTNSIPCSKECQLYHQYGYHLIQKKHPLLIEQLSKEINKLENLYIKLGGQGIVERQEQLFLEIQTMRKVIEWMK